MPLTKTGKEVLANMEKEYGEKKGKAVFYAKAHSMGQKWHHSPDAYEDAGSPDGPSKIHYSATPENVHKSAQPKRAGGTPDKVQANDPTSSPRANMTSKSASIPDSPAGGKTRWASGVDSYPESAKETV